MPLKSADLKAGHKWEGMDNCARNLKYADEMNLAGPQKSVIAQLIFVEHAGPEGFD